MVGDKSPTASFTECNKGVYMKAYPLPYTANADMCSLSTIGDAVAGTVFIGDPPPEPAQHLVAKTLKPHKLET